MIQCADMQSDATQNYLKDPLNQPCTFYIVRHGLTEWNKAKKIQGLSDIPLAEEGVKQAQERALTLKHIPFAAVFSSDLIRAKQTAEILAADHNLIVKTNQLLREKSFNQYEGKQVDEFRAELKELLDLRATLSHEENLRFKFAPNIESDEEASQRFILIIREAAEAYPGQSVLMVSHGAMMYALLAKLGILTFGNSAAGRIENLGYCIIESDGADFRVTGMVGITDQQPIV